MAANNYIVLVEKTMRVLAEFNGEQNVTLARLTSRTRLVKNSVFRILYTLQVLGYVEKDNQGRFSLTPAVASIFGRWPQVHDLVKIADPYMKGLLREFRESINLGALEDDEVLYVHVLESPEILRVAAHPGMQRPVHSTAMGKCLLSRHDDIQLDALLKEQGLRRVTARTIATRAALKTELARVRAAGYAIDNGEDSAGGRCVAGPIFDERGKVVASISISAPASRLPVREIPRVAGAILRACQQISARLAQPPPRTPTPNL